MKLRMKILVLFGLCWPVCVLAQAPVPAWRINITEKFGLQAFDRTINFRWTLHQGVLFISPEKVLVYQVNRSRRATRLASRDASGGSGNFILQIKVLDAKDGSEIKSFDLPTNADFSKVMPTHDGKFIVRTGDILYLYSANFERLASQSLALNGQPQEEAWQIGVSPSGRKLALVHQQIFRRNPVSPTSAIMKASSDIEILDADTLKLIESFTVPSFWDYWNESDELLLASTPQPSGSPPGLFGEFTVDGAWSPVFPSWYSPKQPCSYKVAPLSHNLFAAYGCDHFSVFPRAGADVFLMKTKSDDFVSSLMQAGEYYAIEIDHRTIFRTGNNVPVARSHPLHIDLYDLKGTLALMSIPVHNSNVYFAVSEQGSMVVGDGTSLAFYALKH
jgi:hypothetical protein